MFPEHSGSRRSSGSEFQTVGPATENARPAAVSAETMTWHGKLVTAGRTQTLSEDDVRDWRAVIHQVPRCLVVLASVHQHTHLLLNSIRNIKLVKLIVHEIRQTVIIFPCATDNACGRVQHSL